ncbi:uncharacterized protein LOC142319359 [Lycorma delicatula]|uniref:uncharacterized protein LOC142319359 n=1 Tax=Lycorma delicatula TaxID=130591 RepID=UPI003F519F4F
MDSDQDDCDSCVKDDLSLTSSQFGQVIFHELADIYPIDCDLHCRYTLTQHVQPSQRDRIGIFKVGWKRWNDSIVSKLAPMPLSEREYSTLHITFAASIIPREEDELYQLCYISGNNEILGASIPFGFRRPHENELVGLEDRNNPGLIQYKSRTSILYDKIAILEEEKELAELKVYTLTNQISVLEKEVSSLSTAKNDLNVSLENAKECVEKLTISLKNMKTELEALKTVNENFKTEINGVSSAYRNLNTSLISKEEALQNIMTELNSVKQEKIHAELTLKEVSQYNSRLKEEVDSLKEVKETLISKQQMMEKDIVQLQQKAQKQQHHTCQEHVEPSAPTAGVNMDTDTNILEMQTQLQHALHLLDETLQNQPAHSEQYVTELESNIKTFLENDVKNKEEISKLNDIITKQYQEMKSMNDKLVHLKSFEENYVKKEKEVLDELNRLRLEHANMLKDKDEVLHQLSKLQEDYSKKKDEYESEKQALLLTISKLKEAGNTSEKKEELEEVVRCLREALITEPSFEESCKILIESTRVNAMNTYKDLFESLQFLDFENLDIGVKVRRLLDEFSILKQDLDRCREENKNVYKILEESNRELKRVCEENELSNNKVVEMNEVVSEMSNCLNAVKRDKCELQQVKELKDQITTLKLEKDDLEKQLKEAKIASALTNIGHVTLDQTALKSEVELLRKRVRELEDQQSSAVPQKCCDKMQERLKQSAKEYAKLYNQLFKEREQYQRMLLVTVDSQRAFTSTASTADCVPSTSQTN